MLVSVRIDSRHDVYAIPAALDYYGQVLKWFKRTVLKTVRLERVRGFESHPLRHINNGVVLKRLKRTVC